MNAKVIAFWVMVFFVIGLGIYLIHWTRSESFQCLSNPYTYSVKLLEKSNNAPVQCFCAAQKPGASAVLLDNKGFHSYIVTNYLGNENS